jgi:hypothetical protein
MARKVHHPTPFVDSLPHIHTHTKLTKGLGFDEGVLAKLREPLHKMWKPLHLLKFFKLIFVRNCIIFQFSKKPQQCSQYSDYVTDWTKVQSSTGAIKFLLLQNFQTICGAHPVLLFNGYWYGLVRDNFTFIFCFIII